MVHYVSYIFYMYMYITYTFINICVYHHHPQKNLKKKTQTSQVRRQQWSKHGPSLGAGWDWFSAKAWGCFGWTKKPTPNFRPKNFPGRVLCFVFVMFFFSKKKKTVFWMEMFQRFLFFLGRGFYYILLFL